jgi:hypothetical protein
MPAAPISNTYRNPQETGPGSVRSSMEIRAEQAKEQSDRDETHGDPTTPIAELAPTSKYSKFSL